MKKNVLIFLLTFSMSAFANFKDLTSTAEPIVIKPGKPTIVLASIFAEGDTKADDYYAKRELAELQNNFPEYDVILIDEYRHVIFENNNKDLLSLTNANESIELVAFWDGKATSKMHIEKTKVKATEYISGLTNQNKKSSYLAENEKILNDYNRKKGTFNPNKSSKELGQYYIIDRYFNKMVYGNAEFFKPQNYKGIKSVSVYSQLNDNPEELAFTMNLNDKNQVTDILYAKRSSTEGTVFMVFSYDNNGLLKKMISNENFNNEVESSIAEFAYDNEKIIQYSEYTMWEFSIQNEILINDSYIDFTNTEKDFRIRTSREEIADNCVVAYDDDQISSSYCPSNFDNSLPYTYKNMFYVDGTPQRQSTSKIEKTERGTLGVYAFASALDEFRQVGEVTIGKSGLTEKSTMLSRQQNYTLRFEYK